jgi:hypothetical protein
MKKNTIISRINRLEFQGSRITLKCVSTLLILNFIFLTDLLAQKKANAEKKEIDELRIKLNEDGSHYLKFTFLGQLWFRYNESNPGTMVANEPANQTFDVGVRRLRFQFFGQLSDHTFFYIHSFCNTIFFIA